MGCGGIERARVLGHADEPSSLLRDPGLTQQTTIDPRWLSLSCPQKASLPPLSQHCPYLQLQNPCSVLPSEHPMHPIDFVQPRE